MIISMYLKNFLCFPCNTSEIGLRKKSNSTWTPEIQAKSSSSFCPNLKNLADFLACIPTAQQVQANTEALITFSESAWQMNIICRQINFYENLPISEVYLQDHSIKKILILAFEFCGFSKLHLFSQFLAHCAGGCLVEFYTNCLKATTAAASQPN